MLNYILIVIIWLHAWHLSHRVEKLEKQAEEKQKGLWEEAL